MEALQLSNPQHIFLNELNTKFRSYVGGYGSGKTFVGCLDLGLFSFKHNTLQGYFGPTYSSIRDIFYPTMDEAAYLLGMDTKVRLAAKEVDLFRGGRNVGTIVCRSMSDPEAIIGYKVARALVDEIDVLPKDKAQRAWRKIIARLRLKIEGVINGVGVTTTPEGFNFVYDKFKKEPKPSYSMVQASTYENEQYLPEDYIDSLLEDYPANLVKAYVGGKFVNLRSGSVYPDFDRVLNNTHYVAAPREQLHVGMDFNVYKMVGLVHVIRKNKSYLVDEFTNVKDTPTMCMLLKDRYRDHDKIVYPDASGQHKNTTGASVSDIRILQAEGFRVNAPAKNPFIKDRVNSFNGRILDGKGERHYFVNVEKCPVTIDCLEQQVYDKNGVPDKSNDADHAPDAAGYFVHKRWPLDGFRIKYRKAGAG